MAGTKEIRDRMSSIQDTLKITNAMYMISSSKLRKARKNLADTEPYFYTLQSVMARMLRHLPELIENDKFFADYSGRDPKTLKTGIIVVTGDKGLAGAYNHNVLAEAERLMAERPENKLFVLGILGEHYFQGKNINVAEQFHYTVQNPTISRARVIAARALTEYLTGEVDEIYIVYTRMENAMTCVVEKEKLLPLDQRRFIPEIPAGVLAFVPREAITYKPSPTAVMDSIVPEYLVGFCYGALVESFCSEQNARMTAMKTATDSGRDMLRQLKIEYNRVRQAAITQEITEVCAGARAQKRS